MNGEWRPATEREQTLLDAVGRGDRDAYLAALAGGPVFAPVHPDGRSLMTAAQDGRTYLMAYTSAEMLGAAFGTGSPAYRELTLEQLVRACPDPAWWIAIAPATPLQLYAPAAQLAPLVTPPAPPAPAPATATAAVSVPPETGEAAETGSPALPRPEPESGFTARNELEELLAAAVEQDDLDTVLKLLLLAELVVPVADGGWRRYDDAGTPCVPVFTAASRCDDLLGPVPTEVAEGVAVVSGWPGPEVTLLCDPGTAVEVALPGQAVLDLAGWAAEIGMSEVMEPEPAAPDEPPAPWPVLLQRALPAEHVAHYLQRGYDVVSGLAYRVDRAGSADAATFAAVPGEAVVHVLRWAWHGVGPYVEEAERVRVSAVRMPHGAELRRLHRDGGDTALGVYDADRRAWVPAEGAR